MIEPAAKEKADNISRWFREIWVEGREEIIDLRLPPDGIIHGLTPVPITGPEQFKRFVRSGHRTYRNVSVDLGEIRAATLQATAALTVTATRRRTGKTVAYKGAFLVHFDARGKIAEAWFTADISSTRPRP